MLDLRRTDRRVGPVASDGPAAFTAFLVTSGLVALASLSPSVGMQKVWNAAYLYAADIALSAESIASSNVETVWIEPGRDEVELDLERTAGFEVALS